MKLHLTIGLLTACLATSTWADLSALVVSEPTARKDAMMLSRTALEAGLGKQLGQAVKATLSDDLTDAMRVTRSGGYELFIAPAQVVASAIGHGYELVGSTDGDEQYVLVGSARLGSVADLRQGRIYLPQQDSIYTYLARGLLNAGGLSFKDMRHIEYARFPQAGLTAITLNLSEATVIRKGDFDAWQKDNPGVAKVLATSGAVPGGLSVAVKKDLPADTRARLARWFATSAPSCGMKPVAAHGDVSAYRRVAELGSFTPVALPGVTVVDAAAVKRLMSQGAAVIDTRNEQEFRQKHIAGAVLVPYVEKSLKDVAYDRALDDFSGLDKLDKKAPTIFHCNGPECWKSYKASKAAVAAGFSTVYWFRGGMPEWAAAGN
jgi:rhodanese-related sulfurtransferase